MVGLGQLLGEDVRNICSVKTRNLLSEILENNKDNFASDLGIEKSLDSSIEIVEGLLKGLKG
ncbi:MAG: hypothetical protein U5K00_19745 [Melioribacteraceae bacterium]|nr:hypothetical protein [Melioribacteraceae bacterium]